MGTLEIEHLVELDDERFSHLKIDTREMPSTIIWYHKPVEGFAPIPRNLFGQDELTVRVGQFHKLSKLKFETNLPQLLIFNTTSEENTRTVEINGKEVLTIESNFHNSTTESSGFTVEARLEQCEEPDRCTSQQMMSSFELASNPASYSVNWNVSCPMTDFCNSFGLSSSDVLEINLDTANLHASNVSYTWRYSPDGPQHGLEIKDGCFGVDL